MDLKGAVLLFLTVRLVTRSFVFCLVSVFLVVSGSMAQEEQQEAQPEQQLRENDTVVFLGLSLIHI